MLKKIAILMIWVIGISGCSPNNGIAHYYLFQAEQAIDQATNLKRKISFEKRIPYYVKACELFSKAYERNPDVFTLSRIEVAADSCWKAQNAELEELFRQFLEVYIKSHPQEYEHGDSGLAMIDVGG